MQRRVRLLRARLREFRDIFSRRRTRLYASEEKQRLSSFVKIDRPFYTGRIVIPYILLARISCIFFFSTIIVSFLKHLHFIRFIFLHEFNVRDYYVFIGASETRV